MEKIVTISLEEYENLCKYKEAYNTNSCVNVAYFGYGYEKIKSLNSDEAIKKITEINYDLEKKVYYLEKRKWWQMIF